MIRTVRFFAAALLAFAFTPFATGQGITTGTIKGTVMDASGAVVANAQVTTTNDTQGTQLTTTSGTEGLFSLYAVPIGVYTIDIASPGFSSLHITSVQVNSGATTDLKSVKLQ